MHLDNVKIVDTRTRVEFLDAWFRTTTFSFEYYKNIHTILTPKL
jgi:hypothetical protein